MITDRRQHRKRSSATSPRHSNAVSRKIKAFPRRESRDFKRKPIRFMFHGEGGKDKEEKKEKTK